MALNAAMQGFTTGTGGNMAPHPNLKTSFQNGALPVAVRKNLGIIGMKVMGQDNLLQPCPAKADPVMLFRYTLTLPVAAVVLGMPTHDLIRQNAAWARAFKPLSELQMKEFSRQTAAAQGVHRPDIRRSRGRLSFAGCGGVSATA
jgi:hypothetical protein